MKKFNLAGCGHVFSFTLSQTLKSKAYRVSLVILMLIAFISFPVLSVVTSSFSEGEPANVIKKMYVFNETAFSDFGLEKLNDNEQFSELAIVYAEDSYDSILEKVRNEEPDSVLLRIYETGGIYGMELKYSEAGEVQSTSCNTLVQCAAGILGDYKLEKLELSEAQIQMIFSETALKVSLVGFDEAGGNAGIVHEEDTSITTNEYWFVYVVLFVVLMVNVIANSSVAGAIVEDKASKVIEYLLTSIRPLAIITGKILAMLVSVVLQTASIAVVGFVSSKVTASITGGGTKELIEGYVSGNILENINLLNLIITIIVIILGLTFYAAMAGIAGAMATRQEELSDTLSFFTILNLVGAYTAMGAAGILNAQGETAFSVFALLFPISSPFLLPGAIFLGKVSLPVAAAAIALLILSNVLIFSFVAKIYESLILHMGNSLKLKDLGRFLKAAKKSGGEA